MTPQAIQVLLKHIKQQGLTPHGWALRHNVDPSAFSKIIRGKRGKQISVDFAALVEDATEGEVTMRMWVSQEDQ